MFVDFSRWEVLLNKFSVANKFKNTLAETIDGPVCSKVWEYFPGTQAESPGISTEILECKYNAMFREKYPI